MIPLSVLREYMPKLKDEDLKELGPVEYDQSKVPEVSKKHAENVRRKVYLPDMTESFARGVEYAGLIAKEANVISEDAKSRQDIVEARYNVAVGAMTEDTEVLDARIGSNGITFQNLKKRVDDQEYYINVKSFGAVGDGLTDDTAAIQSAINFAKQGDTVLVPFGSFITTSTILIDKTIKLIMQGKILADHAEIGILAKSSKGAFNPDSDGFNFLDLELKIERVRGKGYQEKSTAVGFKAYNVFNGYIDYRALLFNYTGVQLVGSKYGTGHEGFSYTKGTIGLLKNESKNIHIIA